MQRNTTLSTISTIIFSGAFLFAPSIFASPQGEGHGHDNDDHKSMSNPHAPKSPHDSMKSHDKSGHSKMGHHDKMSHHNKKGNKKSHHGTFTPHWAKTLSGKQKRLVDRMHVSVTKQQAVLKAKIKLNKAELENIMVISPYDKAAAHILIDEMTKNKAEKIKVRYDHVAEMRAILTEDQRLSYDMDRFKDQKHGGK